MRTLVVSLLAATILSSSAFAQGAAPFGAPSEPLSAQEKSAIHSEAAKAKRARAAAAERARKKHEAATATATPEPVISAPVTQPMIENEAPPIGSSMGEPTAPINEPAAAPSAAPIAPAPIGSAVPPAPAGTTVPPAPLGSAVSPAPAGSTTVPPAPIGSAEAPAPAAH